jgi:hypothetical protein
MSCSNPKPLRLFLMSAPACLASMQTLACATCGCTLSADAAMGYSAVSGWRFTLEDDYIDQDQLRGGTSTATPSQVVNNPSNPALGGGEIEKQTVNRYLILGINYSPDLNWNLNLLMPYVDRDHTTYGTQLAPYTPAESAPEQVSSAHVSGLGDIKLIGSYQGLLPARNLGVQLGVKLPTGDYGTRVVFNSGPGIGTPLDASLQAGTGSTDLIVGAYYHQPVSENFTAFVNGQFQSAIEHHMNEPGDDYRPGNTTTVSMGVRYERTPRWLPQLQLNFSHKSADQGALADTTDTAGTVVYASPGVIVSVLQHLQLFGFVQLPVYSRLDGYQLFPHWTASVGASYAP